MQIHQILVRPDDKKMIILYLDVVGRRNSIVSDTTNNTVVDQLITQCKTQLPSDAANPAKDEIQQEISELEYRLGKLKQAIGVA
jgi:hypothetical protein